MKQLFNNLDAALFDLDGTLVETNIDFPLMKREMIQLAVDHGLPESDVAGLDILAIVDRAVDHLRAHRGDEVARTARDEAFAILEEIELRHSADAREIRPARDLVQTLQSRDIKVGIVTRNCRAASEESLARTGIPADVLICRDDNIRTKPCPDQLLTALERLDARAEFSLMVGDHPMDVMAGKAARMRTIAILTSARPLDFFAAAGPDAIVHSLDEILSALIDSNS